ncbi:MAG: hypothetical protein K0S82_2486 [Gaiellaceae bacterium]|nr:hypothetical protein [Gaiellaceae bacterium]
MYILASFQSCATKWSPRDVPGPAASDIWETQPRGGQGVSATEAGSVGREPCGQHGLMRAGGLEPPREFPPNGT